MHRTLTTFWYLYMCGWGIFFPYYSLYLGDELGLAGSRVGIVMATIPLVGLLAQPLWGHIADRTGSRRLVLTILTAGTAVAVAGLALPGAFAGAALATAIFAIFAPSVLPMATSVSLATVGRTGIGRFGWIRMWGTLGFLTMVVVFPRILERIEGIEVVFLGRDGLIWMFPATALCLALAAAVASRVPDNAALRLRSVRGDLGRLLRHPPVVRLLALTFAAHLCLQGSINFFPLFVRERGGDVSDVGRMWIFMLLLEVPLIGFAGHTLRRLGARGLLVMGLTAEGLRWTTCAMTDDLRLFTAVQVFHGVGVAGVLIGAPLYLEQAVPERLRSSGQAFISTVGFGAAAILSNLTFGALLEHLGVEVPYAAAGIGVLVLAGLVFFVLPEPRPPDD